MLTAVAIGLWRLIRRNYDPDVTAVAKVMLILTVVFLAISVGFHTFIQDRAGDAYWLVIGLLLGPLTSRYRPNLSTSGVN